MQATVLIGPGKPRLIQIHRPTRPYHASRQQQQHQHHNDHPSGLVPVTPARNRDKKTSLFSPGGTSASVRTQSSGVPTATSSGKRLPTGKHQLDQSTSTNLDMQTLRGSLSRRRLSLSSSSTFMSLDDHATSSLLDPFGDRWSQESCNTSILDGGSPKPTHSPVALTQPVMGLDVSTSNQVRQEDIHYQSLILAITSTDQALDALAARNFDLTSPILKSFQRDVKTTKCHSTRDYVLIAHLNKIFSQSPLSSLSVLAAWLVVDAYYAQLFSSAPPRSTTSDSYPDLCDNLQGSPPRRKNTRLPQITISAATSPTFSTRPHSRTSLSNPVYASHIPSKARSILGIPNSSPSRAQIATDPTGCNPQPFNPSTLDTKCSPKPSSSSLSRAEGKARIVHASVQVVGRKLVGDLLTERNKPLHSRGKSLGGNKKGRSGAIGGKEGSSVDDVAVNALWEACRCVASLD